MKPGKTIATLAIVGGVAAGAAGVSARVANADPGPSVGPAPVWGPPAPAPWHGDGHGWDGDGRGGRGWDGPGWGGGAAPGGWNGGWEPWGGICLFGLCA
jgi:hypothetical protein